MYAKKIFYTAATAPVLVFMHQAAEYQSRKADEKDWETQRRLALLSQEPQDITPPNKGKHVWNGKDPDHFENEWSMKPVVIKGIFDHEAEMKVQQRNFRGEKGFNILTPFYTHLDADNKAQAIIVNRGWIPKDFGDLHEHQNSAAAGEITGVLYRGEAKTKYSKPNSPAMNEYKHVTPSDLALIMKLPNEQEASQFILKQMDSSQDKRQIMPAIPDKNELVDWQMTSDRHRSYATMWTSLAYLGILSNTMLWLVM